MDYTQELINYIKTHKDWEARMSKQGIRIKKDEKYPLYIFVYNMIECKFEHDWMRACRGHVLGIEENVIPVCIPFYKFWNFGEGKAAQIDWSTAVVREKVDGSFVQYFWNPYANTFQWKTNGTIDASKTTLPESVVGTSGGYKTFGDLIQSALMTAGSPDLNQSRLHDFTLMFELTSPYNKVVLDYGQQCKLTLLGARDIRTMEELKPDSAIKMFGLPFDIPMEFNLNNETDIIDFLKAYKGEGVVPCDAEFNRVKIKAESYLAMHRLKDSNGQMSTKRLFEVVQEGVQDDVRAAWPEFDPFIAKMETTVRDTKKIIRKELVYFKGLWDEQSRVEEKKRKATYANVVIGSKAKAISGMCFDLCKGLSVDSIIEAWFKKADYETLLKTYELLK